MNISYNECVFIYQVIINRVMSATEKQIVQSTIILPWYQQIDDNIQNVYEMRLIQKISSPIDIVLKHKLVREYAIKLQQINCQLIKVKLLKHKIQGNKVNQFKTYSGKTKAEINQKKRAWRQNILKIQKKYSNVFIQGSFKHYAKILKLYAFQQKMDLIDIQSWSRNCLGETPIQQTCPC